MEESQKEDRKRKREGESHRNTEKGPRDMKKADVYAERENYEVLSHKAQCT